MKALVLWPLLACVVLGPGSAQAWVVTRTYDDPAEEGGGGGRSFTGSQAARGLHCAHCHIDGEGSISARIVSEPSLDAGYGVADHFRLRVELTGEHLGLERECNSRVDKSCNQNGFALEITDGHDRPVGTLCESEPTRDTDDDGRLECPVNTSTEIDLTSRRTVARPQAHGNGATEWTVFWIPPAERDLEIDVWAAVVDGNGGDGTFTVAPSDIGGDDTALARISAIQADESGCAAAPTAPALGTGGLWLLCVVLWLALRGRRVRGASLGDWCQTAAVALLAGCAPEPPPPEAPDTSMFTTQIQPILTTSCLGPACHEGPRPAGDLDLSSLEGVQRRPDAILPYGPYEDGLLLLKSITPSEQASAGLRILHAGVNLPSRTDERFKLLEQWVQAGAPPLRPRGVPAAPTIAQPEERTELPAREGETQAQIDEFKQDVEPFLTSNCTGTGCHGGSGGNLWLLVEDDQGAQNFRAASLFVEHGEEPRFSPLLRKLVPPYRGGIAHEGGAFFATMQDMEEHALGRWVASQVGDPPADTRSAEERYFEQNVQPVLVRNGCLFQNCHGAAQFSDLRFDPGVLGDFSRSETHTNYLVAQAQLALGGFPQQSRVVKKPIDVENGGLSHLAIPSFASAADPELQAILEWVSLETSADEERRSLPEGALGRVQGIVYVEAAPGAYDLRHPEIPHLGARLMFAPMEVDDATGEVTGLGVPVEELTADIRAGRRADIRAPAVSYDGDRVVFSMRFEDEDHALLYTADLASREVEPLTTLPGDVAAGCEILDLDPTFSYDGAVVFASTRACLQTPVGPVSTHLYRIDAAGGEPVQLTFSPFQVYAPNSHLDGKIHYSQWRGMGEETPVFRVHPDGFEPRDHLGNRVSPEAIFLGARALADGRELVTRLTPGAQAPVGELLAFTRSFGPPTDNPFRPAGAQELDLHGVQWTAPLPEGRVVVARSSAGAAAEGAPPDQVDIGLYLDSVGDTRATRGARLIDQPDTWEMWPAVVTARAIPLELPVSRCTDPTDTPPCEVDGEAQLLFHSVVLADSLFVNNRREAAPPDRRVQGIRILQACPVPLGTAPDSIHPVPVHERIAEAPLESDGSIRLVVPSNVPLRYESLDRDGLALNSQLWHQSVSPGVTINQNTPVRFFDSFCGGCHGGRNDPDEEPVTVDVLSGASLSAAFLSAPRDATPPDADGPETCGASSTNSPRFARDVWPILEGRCGSCHDDSDPPGGLRIGPDAPTTFAALLAPHEESWQYVNGTPGLARASYLVEVLLGRELDVVRPLSAGAVPEHTLTREEMGKITLWIDLGASP